MVSDHYAIPLPAQTAAKAALYCALRQAHLTQVELAARLHCDEKEVRRLLDPRHASKLARLETARAVLGQQLVIGVQAQVKVATASRVQLQHPIHVTLRG